MQQHEIDVRPRTELAPSQTPNGGKGGPACRAADIRIELNQRGLDTFGDQTPTIRPCGE
jgi:hypothetical protein